jgi:hypothetical protein
VSNRDFANFADRMRKRASSIPLMANEVKKTLAKEVVNQLVPVTPIDTGKARNNWQVSYGSPVTGIVEAATYDASGAFSYATFVTLEAAKPGDAVYIRSNIPYIRRLNEGHSAQARPAGYVQRAIAEAVSITGKLAPAIIARVRA